MAGDEWVPPVGKTWRLQEVIYSQGGPWYYFEREDIAKDRYPNGFTVHSSVFGRVV